MQNAVRSNNHIASNITKLFLLWRYPMRLISLLFITFVTIFGNPGFAKEYRFILPSGPGSLNDTLGRAIADAYNQQNNGNKLIVDNKPGGDMIVAVNAFKKDAGAIILGNSSMHAFNYHFREGGVPYSDSDFDHVTFIGWSPMIWYATPNSGISAPMDMIKFLQQTKDKPFIGVDNILNIANAKAIKSKFGLDHVKEVRYKTAGEVMISTMNGTQIVANGAGAPAVISHIKGGNLIAVGNTTDKDVYIDGVFFPSVPKVTGATGFAAANIISISPQFAPEEARQLHSDIIAAVASPGVQDVIKKIGMTYVGEPGAKGAAIMKKYRDQVGQYK